MGSAVRQSSLWFTQHSVCSCREDGVFGWHCAVYLVMSGHVKFHAVVSGARQRWEGSVCSLVVVRFLQHGLTLVTRVCCPSAVRCQGDLFVRKIVMNRLLECAMYDINLAARQIQGAWRAFYFWKTAAATMSGRLAVREEVRTAATCTSWHRRDLSDNRDCSWHLGCSCLAIMSASRCCRFGFELCAQHFRCCLSCRMLAAD